MLVDGPIGLLTGLPVFVCFTNGREWVRVLLSVFLLLFLTMVRSKSKWPRKGGKKKIKVERICRFQKNENHKTDLVRLCFYFIFLVQVFPPVRRPGRPMDYRDSAYESRRTSQFTGGISLDNFRFISVLGRGHFGKVWTYPCVFFLFCFSFLLITDWLRSAKEVKQTRNGTKSYLSCSLAKGHSGTISQHWRVLCHQSAEKGRHHCPRRGRIAFGREAHLRGGQFHSPSFPRQSFLLFPDRCKSFDPKQNANHQTAYHQLTN